MVEIFDPFETDEALEEEGQWKDFKGLPIKIRGAQSPTSLRAIASANAKLNVQFDEDGIPQLTADQDREWCAIWVSEGLVADWGAKDLNGDPVPCTEENVCEVARQRKHRTLVIQVIRFAREFSNFREKREEGVLGNLPAGSTTKSGSPPTKKRSSNGVSAAA